MSKLRHTLKAAIAALAIGLMAQAASAATLYISEFQNGVGVVGTAQVQEAPQQAITDQTVAIGATTTPSTAFNAKTHYVRLTCDIGCSVAFGPNSGGVPTATTSNFLLSANMTTGFVVSPGQQIAVISNPAGGSGAGTGTSVTQGTVPWVVSGQGTAGTPATGVVTVQGITSGTPIVVGGNVAAGATDSGNPQKIGCLVNTTAPSSLTTGQRDDVWCSARGSIMVGAGTLTGVDGASNSALSSLAIPSGPTGTGTAVAPSIFNAATWDRQFTCASSAVINVTAAATTQLVALSGTTAIRVCSFTITESLAGTAQFVYGTGSNCGTGTTNLTGAMAMATSGGLALSGMNGSLFRAPSGNALCLAAVTGNITGFVTYAQY